MSELMSDDFVLISNPLPEGQKVNLELPLIENDESDDFFQLYFKLVDFYQANLGKKTIVIHTDPEDPDRHSVYFDHHNHQQHVCSMVLSNLLGDPYKQHPLSNPKERPAYTTWEAYQQFNQSWRASQIVCYKDRKYNVHTLIEMMIDYHGWNVVMVTCDKTSKDFHIDRIFQPKT